MNALTINLKTDSKIPLFEQVYGYIKEDIQTGRLRYREKLPSTRALAKHLEVSRSTIALAYEQLLSEGYVEAEAYRGFYVSKMEELYQLTKNTNTTPTRKKVIKEDYLYNFSPRGIDLNSFPSAVWRKLSKEILLDNQIELFRLGNSQGEYSFRDAICNYLHQARGVNCRPEQVIVGAGNDYLLMLLSTIIGLNYKIAFENPTYKQAYLLFERLSYPICTVDMDHKGMEVAKLQKTDANIAYIMPSHQYPLGIVMPIQRRMELLKWAGEQQERYIIEDDYDSEFRYKGKPIPALQGYDANGKVIYLGTFSKSIAPAIRMSYMVLPEKLLHVYLEKSKFISSTVSKVDQLIVQHFLEDGHYERHLNKLRAMYKNRHEKLLNELKVFQNKCTISGEQAGVHVLLTFHKQISERELIAKAKEQGIKVYGLSESYTNIKKIPLHPTIILGYANLTEKSIENAVAGLVRGWKTLLT